VEAKGEKAAPCLMQLPSQWPCHWEGGNGERLALSKATTKAKEKRKI